VQNFSNFWNKNCILSGENMFIDKNDYDKLIKEIKELGEMGLKSSQDAIKYAQKCVEYKEKYDELLQKHNQLLEAYAYVYWIHTGEKVPLP
jgi:hypothetical protein